MTSDITAINFPPELCELVQWVGYRIVQLDTDKKPTKVLYNPYKDYKASSTEPKTWGAFEDACAAVERLGYKGIGFVFSEHDPYAGVDFDDCVVDGVIDPTVLEWVHRFNSYAEISVSGTGVHVILRGVMPNGKGRKNTKRGIEMYDRGRYFTVSGRQIEGTPNTVNEAQEVLDELFAELFPKAKPTSASTSHAPTGDIPADDQELLRVMLASQTGDKIRRLLDGDTNGHSKDHSSADLALCNHLAFWTGKDAARMDRMFRQSKLYRDKWDREDYRTRTINEAIADTTEVYKGIGPKLRMKQTTADVAKLLATATVHVETNGNGYHADDEDQGADYVEAVSTWPYSVKNGRMMHTRINEAKDGTQTEIVTIIADFIATIVGEQIDESGDKVFVIEGRGLRCGHFRVEIPASDYGDTGKLISQLESVSSRDPIHPEGRRHIGTAIKKLTDDNLWQERRFKRTGWDAEAEKFLIRGREPKGIKIDLPRKLAYQIDPNADLGKGLQALASIIQSPGAERGAIIMSHMLLAPMAYLARWRNERSGIFAKGPSGVFKTTTMQNFMAIYGAGFLEDETLVKWGEGATRNAIMKQAASTDDMPFPIDNFKPGTGDGAKGFVNLVHAMMEGGEKDRLNRSSELRESKPILCWPVFTGEDIPDTDPASLARLLVIQFERNGTVENPHLSNAQRFSHHLSAVGGAWLDWLESPEGRGQARLAGEALPIRRDSWARWLRKTAPNMLNAHRVATNLATNELTFEVALKHPTIGTVLAPFAEAHGRGLRAIAQGMGNYTAQSLEAARYLQALRELLSTGRAVLQTNDIAVASQHKARLTEDVERERLQDRLIGWSDGAGGAYLFPGTARQAVAKLLGDNLGGISDNTLFDQLKGLSAIHTGNQKTTFVKRLGGNGIRVLHILPTALMGGDDSDGT